MTVDGRTRRYAHRRPELIAAAADYVLNHGLADLRVRAVAEAVGVSHRTLLHHFPSKEALLAEVLAELRTRDRIWIEAASNELATGRPSVLLEAVWARLSTPDRLGYWRTFFEAYGLAVADPERYAPFLDGIVEDWLAFSEGLLAGVEPDRRRALATLVLAVVRGLLLDRLATDDTPRADGAIAALGRMLDAALSDDAADASRSA